MAVPISTLRRPLIAHLITQEAFVKEFLSIYKKLAHSDVNKRVAEFCHKKFPSFVPDALFCEDLSNAIAKKDNRTRRFSKFRQKSLFIANARLGCAAPMQLQKPNLKRGRTN